MKDVDKEPNTKGWSEDLNSVKSNFNFKATFSVILPILKGYWHGDTVKQKRKRNTLILNSSVLYLHAVIEFISQQFHFFEVQILAYVDILCPFNAVVLPDFSLIPRIYFIMPRKISCKTNKH